MTNPTTPEALLQTLVARQQPESVLQVGLSNLNMMKAVCSACAENESTVITVIEPNLYQDDECNQILEQLQHEALDQTIEFMATSADQVLPDLYFQELSFDLVIMNPCPTYEETFVTFYYLNKMLLKDRLLIVDRASETIMRKLTRHLINELGYKVHTSLEDTLDMPRIERLIREQYARIPSFIRHRVEEFIRPELLITDQELGINGTLIALQKCRQESDLALEADQMIEAMA